MSASETGEFFDVRATRYDRAYDAPGSDGYALRSRLARVLKHAERGPGVALDAGMGAGRLVAELTARGWTTSGIDASVEMVDAARLRLPVAADRLVVATIEELPFEDASFDLVVATGVLEYASAEKALGELARVLRPGGKAVVSYPNPDAIYGIWKSRVWYRSIRGLKGLAARPRIARPRGSRIVPPDAFRGWLEVVGLQPTATEFTGFLVLPTPLELVFPRVAERLAVRAEKRGRSERRLGTQIVYVARKAVT